MIRIFPPTEMVEATVSRLPLSKSISARALILGELSGGKIDESHLADCDDIRVLRRALESSRNQASSPLRIDVEDSGTALRFLTAYFAAKEGADVVLDGSERLCERPVGPLVDALRSLGAEIEYEGNENHAPLHIRGKRLAGGEVNLDASESSQYASALAMVAPTMEHGLRINLGGKIPSLPYLQMTLKMLDHRNIEAHIEAYTAIIPSGKIKSVEMESGTDWTAASYWYAIAAVSAGWVTLPGMRSNSLQGDSVLQDLGERFGVLTDFTGKAAELSATPDVFSRLDLDMSDYPDLVPALAVTGCLTGIPYVFSGVANLRNKESDRLASLAENLARLGFVAEVGNDTFSWEGERMPIMRMPEIDPHGDHRIAMAFAVASFYVPGLIIHNPEVVGKSYPGFFDDLVDAGFIICGPDDEVPEAYRPEE